MGAADRFLWGLRSLADMGQPATCHEGLESREPERCDAIGCDSVRLTAFSTGEAGTVSCLDDPGSKAAAKLASMGILPGARLELLQRYPAFVFRIGHSEFAVDAELADRIRVVRAS